MHYLCRSLPLTAQQCTHNIHSTYTCTHIICTHILEKISKMRALVLLLEIVEISVNKLSMIVHRFLYYDTELYPMASIKMIRSLNLELKMMAFHTHNVLHHIHVGGHLSIIC